MAKPQPRPPEIPLVVEPADRPQDEQDGPIVRDQLARTPRPYHRDGVDVHQDVSTVSTDGLDGAGQSKVGEGDGAHEQERDKQREHDYETWRDSGAPTPAVDSTVASESGTEADDERAAFVRLLPPATLRLRKGLKGGEKNVDALLTPSQLDDEGRRLSATTDYFRRKGMGLDGKSEDEEAGRQEEEMLLRRRLAEFARRSSEVALMGVIVVCVLCGKDVLPMAVQRRWELGSHLAVIVLLILAYPLKLSIVDAAATHVKVWHRFRVPASFDPATVLYPPLLPVLVALSVAPLNEVAILPNLILGLASLPQRLFPRSSRRGGVNTVHWLVSIIPLIAQTMVKGTGKSGPDLSAETLVSMYPLHHALLQPLQYLTTTSLLVSELHLLSVALINLLLLATSPQTAILKACLWIGGTLLLVGCAAVLHWNVTLARVPRWKLRRPGHTAEERKSLVDAVSEIINLQRATEAWKGGPPTMESDADDDEPEQSIKLKSNGLTTIRTAGPAIPAYDDAPKSAVDSLHPLGNGFLSPTIDDRPRSRRFTLPTRAPPSLSTRSPSNRRKPKTKLLWCLQLTPEQAVRRKWLYAAYFYLTVVVVILLPVRHYIMVKALSGRDPFGWALGYLFGQIPTFRTIAESYGLTGWIRLPLEIGAWPALSLDFPLNISALRTTIGLANVRLLLVAYWALVLLIGLIVVFSLTAYVEVDTRRKVFHGVMVAMLLPSVFVDPCYCALALGLVLAIFLLLEVIRAGQVPPLGNAIGRFVAPYVDGRDLRGPVVVSHIFLLIGCAVPLWFSLASIKRSGHGGEEEWTGWELVNDEREVAMVAGVICVGMGDAAASLIGRRYGRRKWIWVGGKSLEGSAAFAVAVTIGLLFAKAWLVVGGWRDASQGVLSAARGEDGPLEFLAAWAFTTVKVVVCACGASFMEAVLTGANDNVVVPVALWLLVKGLRV